MEIARHVFHTDRFDINIGFSQPPCATIIGLNMPKAKNACKAKGTCTMSNNNPTILLINEDNDLAIY
jgi:hypothetical protein